MQSYRRPLAKADGNRAVNAIAKGDYHVKVVMINGPFGHLPGIFVHSKVFLYCCTFSKLATFKDRVYMLPNILFRRIEQVGQLLLRQPDVWPFPENPDVWIF